jgi:hypothetical protein
MRLWFYSHFIRMSVPMKFTKLSQICHGYFSVLSLIKQMRNKKENGLQILPIYKSTAAFLVTLPLQTMSYRVFHLKRNPNYYTCTPSCIKRRNKWKY